jgi:hypothetical protein
LWVIFTLGVYVSFRSASAMAPSVEGKKCHERTRAPQQKLSLLDDLVGDGKQGGWHGEAKHARRPRIDN